MATSEEKENAGTERAGKPGGRARLARVAFVLLLVVAAAVVSRAWLQREAAKQAPAKPSSVPAVVLHVVESADLSVTGEYVGQVESIQTVSLTPEVSARIVGLHFVEGSMVREGDLLFTLDDSQYRATVESCRAALAKAEANAEQATRYYERMAASDPGSVSESDVDTARSGMLQGKADVGEARASLRLAEIDLAHTRITAPIAGQIGKATFTKGNYVTPTSGALAEVVQVDPVRVAFALPDRDYLDRPEAFAVSGDSVYRATILLANGTEYPFAGERDFTSNVMDASTGTIMTRFRFKNERSLLVPGSLVRVTTRPLQSRVVPVIPQEAVGTDGEGDYVYIVGSNDVASRRRVKLGAESGTRYEVISGLAAGETIVASGLQSVRPGEPVRPTKAPPPASDDASTGDETP